MGGIGIAGIASLVWAVQLDSGLFALAIAVFFAAILAGFAYFRVPERLSDVPSPRVVAFSAFANGNGMVIAWPLDGWQAGVLRNGFSAAFVVFGLTIVASLLVFGLLLARRQPLG